MNVKITLLVAAFGGGCLVASASAFPIASMQGDMTTIQFHDDDGGDMAGQILRGFQGRNGYRDRDHDRGFDGRGSYRRRDHDLRRGRDRRDFRERERGLRNND